MGGRKICELYVCHPPICDRREKVKSVCISETGYTDMIKIKICISRQGYMDQYDSLDGEQYDGVLTDSR